MRARERRKLERQAGELETAGMDLSDMHEVLCDQEHAMDEIVKGLKKYGDAEILKRALKVQRLLEAATGEVMVFGEELTEEAEHLMEQADQT
jgi:hypothetical protein